MDAAGEPSWEDFRLVKAVADAGGLPGAAERLGVSLSTVFRRLGQLEGRLGTALFERHRSGYATTAAGGEMVALAARMDADVAAFARRLAGREPAPAGELKVATSDALLLHLLTPLLARFRERYPDVRLDVTTGNRPLSLARRDADVAVRATEGAPPETLVGRRVARLAWALYGRAADFPEPGGGAGVDPEALRRRPWVSPGDDLATLTAARLVREHAPPERVVYRVNTVLGLAEAVEAGIGIGHLPCLVAEVRPGLVRLSPPEHRFAADLWLLTHPDLRQAPRVRVFLDMMAAEIGRLRRVIEGETPA